ncbi:MAG: PepSY-associated TM helix domain-containing protein [Bacteroidota bacterium]
MEIKKNSLWSGIRKMMLEVHLWLGVASSIVLFLVCLSGTVYTFKDEIQQFLEPSRYKAANDGGSQKPTLKEIIARIESESGGKVTAVTVPQASDRIYTFNVRKEGESARGTNIPVNPYSGNIAAEGKAKGEDFFMFMFRLHRWLLLDTKIGRPIVGWATIIFVVLILSGWVIWIPRRIRMWKEGLKVRFSGNWLRLNLDLHRTLGFYASVLLMVMALSGLYWSFEWYRDGMFSVFGVERPAGGQGQGGGAQGNRSERKEGEDKPVIPVLDYEVYIAEANRHLTYRGDYRVSIPGESDKTIVLTKSRTGFFAPPSGDRIIIDKEDAGMQKMELFSDNPLNVKIMRSVKAIHTGAIFGTFSKILYFLACLIATSLPVTGLIIWINRLRYR